MSALLLTALRQYRHNNGEGFVFGYDKEETDRIVAGLIEDRNQQYTMKCKAREQRDELAVALEVDPVGFCEDTALSLAERTFSSEVDEQLAEDVIQYARRLHDMYAVPQPTVQGEPVGRVKTVGGYPDETEHTIEWLCKHKDLKDGDLLYTTTQPAVQGELVGWVWHSYNQTNFTSGSHHKEVLEAYGVKLTPVYTSPQPAPDVAKVVESLEVAHRFIANGIELGYIQMPDSDTLDPAHETLPAIEAALAEYRAQGGDV